MAALNGYHPMLEYLFFNAVFAEKFSRLLTSKSLEFEQSLESVQNATLITTSEDINDDLWDEIDDAYDGLAEQDQQMLQSRLDDDSKINTAGIYIQLKDEQQTIATIDPDVMNRMLEKISMDEFNAFIEAIVSAVEVPDDTPFCERKD
jgi:hypothetical protein